MARQYGSSQTATITAANLASAAIRSSAAITTDTTSNVVDYSVDVGILTTSTAPSGNKQVVIYGYQSTDGTNYDGAGSTVDNVDGTDKALTALGSPTNLTYLGTVQLNQGAVATTIHKTVTIASKFDGVPPKWGIVLYNDAGTALGGTVTVTYRPVYFN